MRKKRCKGCQTIKSFDCFYKSKVLKDGHENKCKICRRNERRKYKRKCKYCKEEFKTRNKKTIYCSASCKPQSRRNRVKTSCSLCGKEVEVKPSYLNYVSRTYCSSECQNEGYSTFHSGENSALRNQVRVNCDTCDKVFYRVLSQIKKYKNNYCSNECRFEGFSRHYTGENSPTWNHDLTTEERIVNRKYEEYYKWRLDVFKRDNFTCQCCSDDKGGNLVAHHVLNYSEHKNLRVDLDNGVTLCNVCHKDFHDTYGYKNNNRKQLEEYMGLTKKVLN